MDADRLELEIRRVSVSQLIESCIETARHRATEKEIAISVQPFNGVPDIAGDRRRLAEVLQNLLDNALQYTLSRGEIVVSAEPRDGEVVFTVADTGIGIPKADQSRIFERFYRVDAARSRELGGTGLGLSIAKHIVEVHGGRIWVDSEVGRGSQFHFSISIFYGDRAVDALTCLESGRAAALPGEVFLREPRINEMEIVIDEHAIRLLRRGSFSDDEMRLIVAALKITNDLERIGDLAVNLAQGAVSLREMPGARIPKELVPMALAVRAMASNSLGALIFRNVEMATEVL